VIGDSRRLTHRDRQLPRQAARCERVRVQDSDQLLSGTQEPCPGDFVSARQRGRGASGGGEDGGDGLADRVDPLHYVPYMASDSTWSRTAKAVGPDGVIAVKSSGRVAGPESELCRPRTRFQAGSISKLVLSAVVLELDARGELHLQAPITDRLEEAPARWDRITLHHLLSNSSGLGHWGDVPGLPPLLTEPPSRDDLVALIADADLVYAPGGGWRYSGPGFVVAALVVEAVTRRPYGEVAAELVFEPARLRSTSSGVFPGGGEDVAMGHRQGQLLHVDPGLADIPGTGDLWTTADDLVLLNRAIRAGRVLDPEVAAQLWTPHVVIEGSDDGGPMVMSAYGYGTFLGRLEGREARINPGDNPGYQSLLAYLPDDDVDLVVLCNEDASVSAALTDLTLR
jgi:CubicO group peptidase (beta-lactamase class C family)